MSIKFPNTPFWTAFTSRRDLEIYGKNSLILFALQLKFSIEDIGTIAATYLIDGSDDKKADMVYIDNEQGVAVIGQSYLSGNLQKKEAKANKASDLNTAVSWLLARPINELPPAIQSPAEELRQAIKEGEINRIYVWYVHNLPESKNVNDELKTVEQTLSSLIDSNFETAKGIEIQAIEVGSGVLNEWYKSISTPILITDTFEIEISGGFEICNTDWRAYVTSIPGKWLYGLYKTYNTKLFSADVREYLGSRKSDKNINERMKTTAKTTPANFWVFNNGITILVHAFNLMKKNGKEILKIKGVSIVNGAQTTGSLGHLEAEPNSKIMVQVRFVMCTNQKTVKDIVKYNNSQNKITAPDFRSGDTIQTRLMNEFKQIPSIEYTPRRGSNVDVIKRKPNLLASVTAGQAIAAFHRTPEVAYHKKTLLWESDDLYPNYFNEQTTARHIAFCYSLLKCIENKKVALLEKSRADSLTEMEESQLKFYRKRGSIFMIQAAIASCTEIFLNRALPNLFKLRFKKNISPVEGAKKWSPIVDIASSFTEPLLTGLSDGFKNEKAVKNAINTFKSLINSVKEANTVIFSKFATEIEVI